MCFTRFTASDGTPIMAKNQVTGVPSPFHDENDQINWLLSHRFRVPNQKKLLENIKSVSFVKSLAFWIRDYMFRPFYVKN